MTYNDIDIPLPAFIAIDFSAFTIALIPIVLRFWLRRRDSKPQPLARNISDGLVVFAWLSGLVLISINAWKNTLRYRYVDWPTSELYYGVPRPLASHLLYESWISLYFIYISLWSSKFALVAFFASVLNLMDTSAARRLVGFATGYALITFFLHIILLTRWCSPVSLNWNRDGQLCSAVHDIRSVSISTVANISTDLVILILPLFALARSSRDRRAHTLQTQISKAEWSGFALVVSVAALSIFAAVARWTTLYIVRDSPKAEITHTIDVWGLVEMVASLLAVSLPTLRTFVRKSREDSQRRHLESRSRGSTPRNQSTIWKRPGEFDIDQVDSESI